MKKPIIKFIIKLLLFCFPVVLFLSFYMATDPFKVLYHYGSYYVPGETPRVGLNRDYVSTETFIDNYATYKYDSFIFGNSRSIFYQVKDWQEHISSKRCFHFDAAAESLYGISTKLNYLNQKKIPIKNVLIILDSDLLAVTDNSQGHLFLKHPELSGQNCLLFQLEFIKAFFNKGFLNEYINLRFSHKIEKNIMNGGYLDDWPIDYNPISNEICLNFYEEMINKNPNDYYLDGKPRFFKRSSIHSSYAPIIKDNQKRVLYEISEILNRNKTDYRIVISPLYNQIKFNVEDLKYLSELFGRKNVYDFSGINNITNNIMNYYDWSHYRPHVAKYILDVIYK